jgi:hypothetical protein
MSSTHSPTCDMSPDPPRTHPCETYIMAISLNRLDHFDSTDLACKLCHSTVAPIFDLPDDGWSRTPLCHKCQCTLQTDKIATNVNQARYGCFQPAVYAGRCLQCLHGAPVTLRRYQQSNMYQDHSPSDPPPHWSDLDKRPRLHASIPVSLPVITQGTLNLEITLATFIWTGLLEIDSLTGGHQGDRFRYILWTRSTDVIDGAGRRGGWSRLSNNSIPEYIDGKLRWRAIHTTVLDSSPSVVQSVGLEPSTSPA